MDIIDAVMKWIVAPVAAFVWLVAQTDAFQGHHHDVKVSTTQVGNNGGGGVGTGNLRADAVGTSAQAKDVASNGSNGSPRIASETRPRNVALLACIKF